MGVFGEFAAEFLDRAIPVVPTIGDDGKRPAIRNWNKLGLSGSRDLLECGKYNDANLALIAGKRSRLTILDVDTTDKKVLNGAMARFGESPIIIQTASGKFHAYYRYNGERRTIRPMPDIDILGDGICVAPPSKRHDLDGRLYEFVHGDLDDLQNLPVLENIPDNFFQADNVAISIPGRISKGRRTKDLFRELRAIVNECADINDLMWRACAVNERYDPPLPEQEVVKQVNGVYKLFEEGRCIVPGSKTAAISAMDTIALSDKPSAYVLLGYLRAQHGPSHQFAIGPEGLATVLSMSLGTIKSARKVLRERGYIKRVKKGQLDTMPDGTKKRSPDKYRLSKGQNLT